MELKGVRFFAYHGIHEEEAKIGNEFEVDLYLEHTAPDGIIEHLDDTINYAAVYATVKEEMQVRQALLETCMMRIAERLGREFPKIERLRITLRKMAPPIPGFIGSVGVTYSREFI